MTLSYPKRNSFSVEKSKLQPKVVPLQFPQIIALESRFNKRLDRIQYGSTVAHDVDCTVARIVRAHHYGV